MNSITFIFPHPAAGPTGGYKVVYEYANRLVADGVEVHMAYSGSIYWAQKPLRFKASNCVRYLQGAMKGFSGRRWFPLDKRVKEHLTFSMNYRHMPKTDIYVATSPYTADYLNDYPIDGSRKYYFIQGKEDWGPGLKSILEKTYLMELNKIVISQWLQIMLKDEYDQDSVLVHNGFDFESFKLTNPIEERNPLTVSLLYHDMPLKRTQDVIDALRIVRQRYPKLEVAAFGAKESPEDLPEWITYYHSPSPAQHLAINNHAAIYVAASESEGWGLTVGEAMICGQAVCCTDIGGYREMAKDGETALLSLVRNPEALAANIMRLIEDNELRISIARCGNEYIQQFCWEESYEKLKDLLLHL